jgi:DNA primase
MISGVIDEIVEKNFRLVRARDQYMSAACPFHKDGQERHPSFWVNRATGEWGCFACHVHGDDIRDLMKKIGVRGTLRIDALLEEAKKDAKRIVAREKREAKKKARLKFRGQETLPESLLGVFNWAPAEMMSAGFTEETLRQHDIGYDRERGNITFPLRDIYGNLIGISGRQPAGCHPKYKIYSGKSVVDGKTRDNELGEWFPEYGNVEPRDHLWRAWFFYEELFNDEYNQLVLVEGFKAALWMVQNGWFHTGALIGSSMSKQQEKIIKTMGADVWVFGDNDDAGQDMTYKVSRRLARSSFNVYACEYPEGYDGCQPDDLAPGVIEEVLSTARRIGG